MRSLGRRASLLLILLLILAAVEFGFGRGMALGRIFAFMEIGGFALGMLWKVVLVVIVVLWLRSMLGKKGD
jgi:ABC-type polysaccharide/polyol phosphate export permease